MDTKFSIAVHILILISESPGRVNSDQMAKSVGTNASYIRKILSRLKRAKIVDNQRGISNYLLTVAPERLTLLEIYRAVISEPAIHLLDIHQNSSKQCVVGRHIQSALVGMFADAEQSFTRSLAEKTLADCISDIRRRNDIENRPIALTLFETKRGTTMSKIKIMTDSASDISYADEQKYGISVIPFPITLGDKCYLSRVDFDNEQFFSLMEQCDEIPKTSQITPFQFSEIYLKEAEAGVEDLILVLINSKGSSTYDNSVQAIELFYGEHPEYRNVLRIHSLDGMGYNALYGSPVIHAAQMLEDGASAQEILNYLTDTLPRRQIYFGIYDLKYAAKSGRIPSAAAFLGTALNMKPVMKIFDNGITTAAKCRGERKLVEKVAEMSIADMEPGSPYELIYGSDRACLEELRHLMTEQLGYEPIAAYQIGAAVAANSGPRIVGVSFTRKAD